MHSNSKEFLSKDLYLITQFLVLKVWQKKFIKAKVLCLVKISIKFRKIYASPIFSF